MTNETERAPAKDKGLKRALLPFRALAWVAGALSLVNLIKDLDWVELTGLLAE